MLSQLLQIQNAQTNTLKITTYTTHYDFKITLYTKMQTDSVYKSDLLKKWTNVVAKLSEFGSYLPTYYII